MAIMGSCTFLSEIHGTEDDLERGGGFLTTVGGRHLMNLGLCSHASDWNR